MPEEPADDTLRETMEALERAISEQAKACPSCGEPPPEGAAMCPHCGAVISTAAAEVPPPPPPEESAPTERRTLRVPEVGTPAEATGFAAEVGPEPPPPGPVPAHLAATQSEEPVEITEVDATDEEVSADASGLSSRGSVPAVNPPPSRRRLWAAVALGVGAYLVAVPVGFPIGIVSVVGTIFPAAAVMVLGAVAVATGVGLFAASTRRVETIAMAVVTDYVCPLCGTDVAPDAPDCPTCGALLTD